MVYIVNSLINLSIVIGLLSLSVITARLIWQADGTEERARRIYLFLAAFLAFLLSKVVDKSLSDVLLQALSTRSLFDTANLSANLASGASGVLVARFLLKASTSESKNMRFRAMLFLGPLILLYFSDLFLAVKVATGSFQELDPRLAPNITFLLCLLLYSGFYEHGKIVNGRRRWGWKTRLTGSPKKMTTNWRDIV